MAFKVYMEITNRCNLACSFCPGTHRTGGMMSLADFRRYADAVADRCDYLYFHLMGEPLLHPDLPDMIAYARERGMKPILTTNGTLLPSRGAELLEAGVYKVSISLHSFEANDGVDFYAYLEGCLNFASLASRTGRICALRLWNLSGGRCERNQQVLDALARTFPRPWKEGRQGSRLAEGVYLEWGDYFDWPDLDACDRGERCFCYGLRDQIGVLCDGRVVPCCLDKDGTIVLGDLNRQTTDEILSSPRARAIYDGFSAGKAVEPLCRRCGFAHDRFGEGKTR